MTIELATIIFAIVNFALLVFLLTKFLYKPTLKMLDERKAGISEALDKADEARREVAATNETIRANMAAARTEAQSIIADSKDRGEAVKDEIIESARTEASAIAEQARIKIIQEKEQALIELKGQIAEISILLAEKILSEGLTAEQEHSLMEKFIKEVGQMP